MAWTLTQGLCVATEPKFGFKLRQICVTRWLRWVLETCERYLWQNFGLFCPVISLHKLFVVSGFALNKRGDVRSVRQGLQGFKSMYRCCGKLWCALRLRAHP